MLSCASRYLLSTLEKKFYRRGELPKRNWGSAALSMLIANNKPSNANHKIISTGNLMKKHSFDRQSRSLEQKESNGNDDVVGELIQVYDQTKLRRKRSCHCSECAGGDCTINARGYKYCHDMIRFSNRSQVVYRRKLSGLAQTSISKRKKAAMDKHRTVFIPLKTIAILNASSKRKESAPFRSSQATFGLTIPHPMSPKSPKSLSKKNTQFMDNDEIPDSPGEVQFPGTPSPTSPQFPPSLPPLEPKSPTSFHFTNETTKKIARPFHVPHQRPKQNRDEVIAEVVKLKKSIFVKDVQKSWLLQPITLTSQRGNSPPNVMKTGLISPTATTIRCPPIGYTPTHSRKTSVDTFKDAFSVYETQPNKSNKKLPSDKFLSPRKKLFVPSAIPMTSSRPHSRNASLFS